MNANPNSPLVSVIMAAYNAERYVGQAIQSILDQTHANLELLVREDGSTDGTRAEIARFRDPRVRLIENAAHVGAVAARNEAIAAARGKYALIMDADDVADARLVEAKVEFCEAHPDIGALGSAIRQGDEQARPVELTEFPQDPDVAQVRMMAGSALPDPGLMVRLDVLRLIGGYRTDMPMSYDWDLKLRLTEACEVTNLAEPLLIRRRWPGQVTRRKQELMADCKRRVRRAMRARRLFGRDDFDPTRPEAGRLHLETRSAADKARLYALWAKGFASANRWGADPAAAWRCRLKAIAWAPTSPAVWNDALGLKRAARRVLGACRAAASAVVPGPVKRALGRGRTPDDTKETPE